MLKKLMSSFCIGILCSMLLISGCSSKTAQTSQEISQKTSQAESEKVTVTDMAGRTVTLNKAPKKVIAVNAGALRLYCYINGANNVVGAEKIESDVTGRPYAMAYPELSKLPIIGVGGAKNVPDAEKILSVNPDIIFMTYTADKSAADELQAKTKVPVVCLSYGNQSAFDPDVNSSLKIIGKVMGKEKRADEVIDYIKKCQDELNNKTKDIPDAEKPSVYIGALGASGAHGIESTQENYSIFKIINAKNVVSGINKTGSVMIDKEKLLKWNPDKLFIDEGGLSMVQQDYKKNPQYYETLSAVKKGEIYSQMPYNFYTTNIDTAMTDAYYMAKVLYPDKFKDMDPVKKADEIYKSLLGKPLYEDMAKTYGGFKKLTLN